MKKLIISTSLMAIVLVTQAQDKTAMKYAATITSADASKRLNILASDAFEGRETGKPGAAKAAQYIKEQFQSFGLKAPVNGDNFQLLDLKEKTMVKKELKANGEALTFLKDYYVLPNSCANIKKTFTDFVFVGYGKADSANYIYVIGSEKLSSTLKQINEKANNTYTHLTLDYKYDDPSDTERIYYRSDHYNFAKHNIPIIFYFNGTHEDYHKKTDEVKKINFPLLAKRAQLVFFTAWELANNAKKPVVDRTNDMPSNR